MNIRTIANVPGFVPELRHVILVAISLFLILLVTERQAIWHVIDFEKLHLPVLAGILLFSFHPLLAGKHSDFWMTFFHELTHALFAMLSHNKVTKFHITSSGKGSIQGIGNGNWVISLSPYFFPIHTVFLMLISTIASKPWQDYINLLVAASYVFFILTQKRDLGFHQSDIRTTGLLFSTVIIIELNLLFLLMLIFFLQGDIGELVGIISDAWHAIFESTSELIKCSPISLKSVFIP